MNTRQCVCVCEHTLQSKHDSISANRKKSSNGSVEPFHTKITSFKNPSSSFSVIVLQSNSTFACSLDLIHTLFTLSRQTGLNESRQNFLGSSLWSTRSSAGCTTSRSVCSQQLVKQRERLCLHFCSVAPSGLNFRVCTWSQRWGEWWI